MGVNRTLRTLVLSILLVFIAGIKVQAQSSFFQAQLSQEQVVERGTFQINFTLENREGSRFQPPDFSPFKLVGGPFNRSSTSIVNGKVSSSRSIGYTLQAPSPGIYTIGSAQIELNRQIVKTAPVQIKVTKAPTEAQLRKELGNREEDIFVLAQISKDTAYVGQQIFLSHILYTRVDIQNVGVSSMPGLDDFLQKGTGLVNKTPQQVEWNGKIYTSKLIRRTALFPKRSGEFSIEPATVKVDIVKGKQRVGNFLTFPKVESKFLTTNAINVRVFALPDGAPESFNGAVGYHAFKLNIDKFSLSTDDAATVTVKVKGTGDSRRLKDPVFKKSEYFEFYDAKRKQADFNFNRGVSIAENEWEVLLVPKKSGKVRWIPEFSYFDTDSARYVRVYPDTIDFNFSQGSGVSTVDPELLESEMENFYDQRILESRLYKKKFQFFGSFIFWIVWSVFPLLIILYFLLPIYKKYREERKPAIKVEDRAIEILSELEKQNNVETWTTEAHIQLTNVICERFYLPKSEYSLSRAMKAMEEKDFPVELRYEYEGIHKALESLAFTGIYKQGGFPRELHGRIVRWFEEMRDA